MEKLKLAFWVARKMISDSEERMREAIEHEQWSRAADIQSYISGMQQILIVFEQSVEEEKL